MRFNPYSSEKTADYNHYGLYLRNKFSNQKIYKISIDAGFTCPNRDGTKGWGGCHYCNVNSFTPPSLNKKNSLLEQIQPEIKKMKNLYNAQKFIAYFQPNTNTYAPIQILKKNYDEALNILGDLGVGLAIGTRIDCLNDEIIDLLDDYGKKFYVVLELGLESIYEETLSSINRGHSVKDFEEGIKKLYNKNFHICVHTIFGLPNETIEMQLKVASFINNLDIQFLKLHQLHITKDSVFEKKYKENPFPLYSLEEYTYFLSQFIPKLKSSIIIERIFATSYPNELIAPIWGKSKSQIHHFIEEYLKEKNIVQGSLL